MDTLKEQKMAGDRFLFIDVEDVVQGTERG